MYHLPCFCSFLNICNYFLFLSLKIASLSIKISIIIQIIIVIEELFRRILSLRFCIYYLHFTLWFFSELSDFVSLSPQETYSSINLTEAFWIQDGCGYNGVEDWTYKHKACAESKIPFIQTQVTFTNSSRKGKSVSITILYIII